MSSAPGPTRAGGFIPRPPLQTRAVASPVTWYGARTPPQINTEYAETFRMRILQMW